jgi:hypothetical protein
MMTEYQKKSIFLFRLSVVSVQVKKNGGEEK